MASCVAALSSSPHHGDCGRAAEGDCGGASGCGRASGCGGASALDEESGCGEVSGSFHPGSAVIYTGMLAHVIYTGRSVDDHALLSVCSDPQIQPSVAGHT